MNLMREVTEWEDCNCPNHIYLFTDEGSKAIAYMPSQDTRPIWFRKPLRIDRRKRQFKAVGKRETEIRESFEL